MIIIIVIFQANIVKNIILFQLLKCEDLLLYFVIYDCKVNILGCCTSEHQHLGLWKFLWVFFTQSID